MTTGWQPMKDAPLDTTIIVYGYEIDEDGEEYETVVMGSFSMEYEDILPPRTIWNGQFDASLERFIKWTYPPEAN